VRSYISLVSRLASRRRGFPHPPRYRAVPLPLASLGEGLPRRVPRQARHQLPKFGGMKQKMTRTQPLQTEALPSIDFTVSSLSRGMGIHTPCTIAHH
jgi:hypothetical protein